MFKSRTSLFRRELKKLSSQLRLALQDSNNYSEEKVKALVLRIRNLMQTFRGYLRGRELRRILGSLAVIFGLSVAGTANAQSFGPAQSNPFGLTVSGPSEAPAMVDIDGDGDADVMSGGTAFDVNMNLESSVNYFQNTGTTTPQFAPAVSDPFSIDIEALQTGRINPTYGDLDGDGDMDIIFGGLGLLGVYYLENTGTAAAASFGVPVQYPFGFNDSTIFSYPSLVDMDGDGDLDIINSQVMGPITFSENIGTAVVPVFASAQVDPFGIMDPAGNYSLSFVAVGDLDSDGDMDIIGSDYYQGILHFYENTGSSTTPQFSIPMSNPSFLPTFGAYVLPGLGDVDGDGDVDILVSLYSNFAAIDGDEEYVYHENISGGASLNEENGQLKIYPNVVTDLVTVDLPEGKEVELTLMDQSGKVVRQLSLVNSQVDLSDLPKGSYILQATFESQHSSSASLVKQ